MDKPTSVDMFVDATPKSVAVVFKAYGKTLTFAKRLPEDDARSTNTAEYLALISGLRMALKKGYRNLRVYSDSMLVVWQVKGKFKTRKKHLRDLRDIARLAIENFDYFYLQHIPGEKNLADKPSREVLKRGCTKIDTEV